MCCMLERTNMDDNSLLFIFPKYWDYYRSSMLSFYGEHSLRLDNLLECSTVLGLKVVVRKELQFSSEDQLAGKPVDPSKEFQPNSAITHLAGMDDLVAEMLTIMSSNDEFSRDA